MNSYNVVGRVGKDAVTRQAGDQKVTSFSLAVDSGYGDRKQTLWLDCSGWGKRFEGVASYLVKGAQIAAHGELGTREHEGKTYLTLKLADLTLVGGKAERPSVGKSTNSAKNDDFEDSSVPF